MKGQLSCLVCKSWNCIYFGFISLAETINWCRRRRNWSAQVKPLMASFRKHHKSIENSSSNWNSEWHSSIGGRRLLGYSRHVNLYTTHCPMIDRYTHIHAKHANTQTHTHTSTCTHARVRTCACTHTHTHTVSFCLSLTHTHTYTHTHTHTHTHTASVSISLTHTHIHTCTQNRV